MCFSPVAAVAASEIYRCEDRGQVTYQQAPCARGKAVRTWPQYETVKPPQGASQVLAAEGRALARSPSSRRGRNARRASAPGAAIGRSRGDDAACQTMRRKRAAAYEKAGLKRNFALSSHWDNKVQQACQ